MNDRRATEDGSVLIFNAGSSSLKFGVFDVADGPRLRFRGAVRDIGHDSATYSSGNGNRRNVGKVESVAGAAAIVLDDLMDGSLKTDEVVATGHRIVHGGDLFTSAARLDAAALRQLESINHLAPLHNPHSLSVVQAVQKRFTDVPTIADFDTAWFHGLPEAARQYAIPAEWSERYAIRRYGFHGLAHRYMAERLAAESGCAPARVLSLQLGQGCSVTALLDGRPVETSMGFTPLEGLVMGTRSGDIDAGAVLYLLQQGHTAEELEDVFNRRSGLLGLSGESDDVRRLLELESQQHTGARLALASFCHRVVKYLGGFAAVLGGIDAITFGGGIGENSPPMRARICAGLGWLGLGLDSDANAACAGRQSLISSSTSQIAVYVIPVDEELLIARSALAILRGDSTVGEAVRELQP